MRRALCGLPLSLLLSMVPHSAGAAESQSLWLISGQSNALGRGALPGPDADPQVTVFDPAKKSWVVARDPLPIGMIVDSGGLAGTGVGPWVAAAIDAAQDLGPIALAGYACGGQSLEFWDKGRFGATGLAANAHAAGMEPTALLWYQGENDGLAGAGEDAYAAKLADWFARARASLHSPELTIVVVQIGGTTKATGDLMPIREAQRRVVAHDRHALLVPTIGLPLQDFVHLTTASQRALGHQIALAMRHERGMPCSAWPGPVLDAAVRGTDSSTCIAHFAEATSLATVTAADFGAIDSTGPVACVGADAQRTRVLLRFPRALGTGTRIVYGFGPNPSATLTDEAGNRAPAVAVQLRDGPPPADAESAAPDGAQGTRRDGLGPGIGDR